SSSLSTVSPCHIHFFLCSDDLAFFSFYSFRPLLALHSFPTRRSSDLGEGGAVHRFLHPETLGDSLGEGGFAGPQIPHEGQQNHLDRKSTRLNSSHVKISYAVFCLKKKKTTNDTK